MEYTMEKTTNYESNKLNELQKLLLAISNKDLENGQRIYYELRIQEVLKPFEELAKYCKKYKKNKEFLSQFNQNCIAKLNRTQNHSTANIFDRLFENLPEGEEKRDAIQLANALDFFAFRIRDFIFHFGSVQDHEKEFGDYRHSEGMPFNYEKGQMISINIINHLIEQNFDENSVAKLSDEYIRNNIAQSYKVSDIKTHYGKISKLKKLLKNISDNRTTQDNEEKKSEVLEVDISKRTTGFEIEANSGSKILAKSLQQRPATSDPEIAKSIGTYLTKLGAFPDKKLFYDAGQPFAYGNNSAGVFQLDPTVSKLDEDFGIEYASAPFTFVQMRNPKNKILKFFEIFTENEGYTKSDCAFQQHVNVEDFDIEALKRLAMRTIIYEDEIMGTFCDNSRIQDHSMFGTALKTQAGPNTTEKEKYRNQLLMTALISLAKNKKELIAIVNLNNKYNFINFLPDKTVEFRCYSGTLNTRFIEKILEFNLGFVQSAKENNPIPYDKNLLKECKKLAKTEFETREKNKTYKQINSIPEMNFMNFDYEKRQLSKDLKERIIKYRQNIYKLAVEAFKFPIDKYDARDKGTTAKLFASNSSNLFVKNIEKKQRKYRSFPF